MNERPNQATVFEGLELLLQLYEFLKLQDFI